MTGRPRVDPITRFWAKVKKTRGCWLFQTNSNTTNGYGQFRGHDNEMIYAHVFSYLLHKGDLPKGKPFVLHTCDVRNCVKPNHLWAGTQKDNIQDMLKKGRNRPCPGEKNGMFGRRSLGFTGRKHSKTSRMKMSRSQTGRKHSVKTKQKLSSARKKYLARRK